MSKSYRYDPDADGYADRPSWERKSDAGFVEDGASVDFGDGTPVPKKRAGRKGREANPHPPMTPEWAIELMKGKVSMTVGALVSQRVIPPHEREDYVQEFNILVWNALPQFDPGRVDESGNRVGVERFLSVAIENAARNVKMRVARRRKNVPLVPFLGLGDGEGGDADIDADGGNDDALPCDASPYKSHRRFMEALWVRMDLESLSRRLTREERLTLSCRLAEFTYQEIAEYVSDRMGVGVLRFHVMGTTMPSLRRKARACGFEPHPGHREEAE